MSEQEAMALPQVLRRDGWTDTVGEGEHNTNLDDSCSRIIKGGSWKRQRIVVVIPSGASIWPKVYLSHCGLVFPPNQAVHRVLAEGLEVGDAYSRMIEAILASELSGWEYVLTIENDNMPPQDGVLRLITRMEAHPEFACIGGLYWTKGPSGVPQIWGDVNDPVLNFRPQVPVPDELVECCGTGMGFNLWRMSMFKDPKLPRPLFQTKCSATGTGTQDLTFWGEARKHGYRCAIDCGCRVGHYDHEGRFGPPEKVW